jgi:hypothetical protein
VARIRTIKPEFWTDERIGSITPIARLLFIGLWNFADDYGNVQNSPKQIKAQVFPFDNLSVEPMLIELIENALLVEYEVDSRKYLHIKNFSKHQRVDRPSNPSLPLYEGSTNTRRVLDESSMRARAVREGKGEERNKDKNPPPPPQGGLLVDDLPTNPGLPKRQKAPTVSTSPNPEGLDAAAWEKWTEYRKAIKRPLKPASYSAAKRELTTHGANQMAVVDKSIANGWQGLFPLRSPGGQIGGNLRLDDETRDNLMRAKFLGTARKAGE